ncbi:hypothetical protein [Pseudomonas sp. MF6747]|uniref:hypothetical protein n=1 Tax=Pseudomonas sp. MF6747 TaxID=2797527 RepID=UPI00190BD901|nr:hypothetical protein [Pseudomonas sp. MF6747]MBK3510736.1 hypothetical protein [Pseudomonas sp. MF6747]
MTDYTKLQARCQRPVASLYEANDLLAKCREALGRLVADNDHLALCARQWEDAAMQWGAERDQLKAENEALLTALKGMTSMYGFCWDLVDGGLLCMQSNVQRFEDAHEAAQKVLAAMSKGEQS